MTSTCLNSDGPEERRGNWPRWATWAGWSIGLLGTAVRVRGYLFNRAVWLDEAHLALNIVNRSMGGLFKPLDHEQGAPFGFLVVEKLAVICFGNNELALRLVPMLA